LLNIIFKKDVTINKQEVIKKFIEQLEQGKFNYRLKEFFTSVLSLSMSALIALLCIIFGRQTTKFDFTNFFKHK